MQPVVASLFLCCALFAPQAASAVSINWSPVGNPGNAADTNGLGAVSYAYNIGTYDVTNSQYAEFLNTKDPSGANALGLYNSSMNNATYGGIKFTSGNSPGAKYTLVSGRENHPVNYVNWYDAIRFVNWLANGQGTNGDTESGTYSLASGNPPSNALTIARSAGATVFLPTEDESYKAAYYNPATHSYFYYPTSSNTAPTAVGPTAAANSANYGNAVVGPTNVGAYTGSASPYGTFDQGGNVFQWNETLMGSSRGVSGGAFNDDVSYLFTPTANFGNPLNQIMGTGFRVAEVVPEPSTGVLAALAAAIIWWWRRRFG